MRFTGSDHKIFIDGKLFPYVEHILFNKNPDEDYWHCELLTGQADMNPKNVNHITIESCNNLGQCRVTELDVFEFKGGKFGYSVDDLTDSCVLWFSLSDVNWS